ncbi:MAG: hypothetical protein Q9218_002488 [Villophora microphyllina]
MAEGTASQFPTFKRTDQEVIDFYSRSSGIPIPGVPEFDHRRLVDGQRRLTFLKPLPPSSEGRQFEVRSKVLGVYDKGKVGSVVETETILAEKGGDEYTKAVGSAFFVGQGSWGGSKGNQIIKTPPCMSMSQLRLGPSTPSYPPPEGKKPDVVHVTQTNKESAHLYRLNGDYNPLHATPEPGQKMGFGGAIMHGFDPANLHEFEARFAAPVKPGDKLVTEAWRMGDIKDGWEEVRFVTRVEGGKIVLSNGRALMKCSGPKSRL